MKAVAVIPQKAKSAHLVEIAKPDLSEFKDGRGVLVEVLCVGACGTDREINDGEYGTAPHGDDFLILGHENFGRVVETGANAHEFKKGDFVVATVRRPRGQSIYDAIGEQDFTTDTKYYERGVSRLHGFMAEFYAENADFLIKIPPALKEIAVLLEPLSIIEKGLKQADDIQRRLGIWQPKNAAVIGTGSVGLMTALALRLRGFEVHGFGNQPRRGYLNAALCRDIGATYDSTKELSLLDSIEKYGSYDLVFECTGHSPLVFEAMRILNENGILILSSVTNGDCRTDQIPTDEINQKFVTGNRVMVGTVNASREHFEHGVKDLALGEATYPGWLAQMLTHKIKGLKNFKKIFDVLEDLNAQKAIKAYLEIKKP